MGYYDALTTKWAALTGTTEQKLAAINSATAAGSNRPVPIVDVMTYLRTSNLWLPIKAATGTSQGAAAAVDYNSDLRAETLDFSLAIVQAMLADLVTNKLLTQDQSDALTKMGTPDIPWWQVNGYNGPITARDLADAGGLS